MKANCRRLTHWLVNNMLTPLFAIMFITFVCASFPALLLNYDGCIITQYSYIPLVLLLQLCDWILENLPCVHKIYCLL